MPASPNPPTCSTTICMHEGALELRRLHVGCLARPHAVHCCRGAGGLDRLGGMLSPQDMQCYTWPFCSAPLPCL
jgi:hypothetical protein